MELHTNILPVVLCITSFPPRECGIASYSQDLVKALKDKFKRSFDIMICPLESNEEQHIYDPSPKYALNVSDYNSFIETALQINKNQNIKIVLLQHEFGFFNERESELKTFLTMLQKEVVVCFHTVLPNPDIKLKKHVTDIIDVAKSILVMTGISSDILVSQYGIQKNKIKVITHGTHLLPSVDKPTLRKKYDLEDKRVLSTFGLLSSGKNIETTLLGLPQIIKKNPETLFLIIGKTHPTVVKREGEIYRDSLHALIAELHLERHVRFINKYLPLSELLEYLQITEIYLFTSKDRNQAVSGTFSYAVGCGCPVISTPIPHSREVLNEDTGIIIDFEAPHQLADAVNKLLADPSILEVMSLNALHKMASTAWENSAIAHAHLFQNAAQIELHYLLPSINLTHIRKMTTDFGMIQFAQIDKPDLSSGYTLDDNARAMIAMCQHFEIYREAESIELISIYLNFIDYCLQPNGKFLNYVDIDKNFTDQNYQTNLEDSNGRAAWALGYLISLKEILPSEFTKKADAIFTRALPLLMEICSTRSMAFTIKGLCHINSSNKIDKIRELSDRLVQMYRHESDDEWRWFESYLTYGNSVIPEALLFAAQITGSDIYKDIAKESFHFLISAIFVEDVIRVISNQGWKQKGEQSLYSIGAEQPIDVAYTILALKRFYTIFRDDSYLEQMNNAFNWFLGKNHLNQIIYNPSTGGCYDGLEQKNVNLNQGAESTVSYLMARITMKKNNFV